MFRLNRPPPAAHYPVHVDQPTTKSPAAPSHVGPRHADGPPISGSSLQKSILSKLKELNADRDVLYMAELRKRPGWQETNQELSRQVAALGFTRPSDKEYRYTGKNPATALRALSELRPLVFDCGSVLHFLTHLVLLETLGEPAFNDQCDGVLAIARQDVPPVPRVSTAYYCARHETGYENLLPHDLQTGDQLWIQGPADGFAFHPASEVNGFNVLVDKTSGSTQLIGFVSEGTATHGRWSYGTVTRTSAKGVSCAAFLA